MKKQLVIILLLTLIFQSCVSNRYLKSKNYLEGNSGLVFFEPLIDVYSVESPSIQLIGSKPKYRLNDSLSEVLKQRVYSNINKNKKKYKIGNKIASKNETVNLKIKEELVNLLFQCKSKLSIKNIKLPPTIDSVLESKNKRFAFAFSGLGFSYKKENFLKKTSIISASALSLGIVSGPPIKNQISFYSIIMDSKEDNIAYIRSTLIDENTPTDSNIIKRQLEKLFKDNTYKD